MNEQRQPGVSSKGLCTVQGAWWSWGLGRQWVWKFSAEVGFEENSFLFWIIYRPPTAMFDRFIAGFDGLMLKVKKFRFEIYDNVWFWLWFENTSWFESWFFFFFKFYVISLSILCGHTSYEDHRALCDLNWQHICSVTSSSNYMRRRYNFSYLLSPTSSS